MTDLNTILSRLSNVADEVEHIRADLQELPHQDPKTVRAGDLTLVQVAERVGRSVSTVRGWAASGELEAFKFRAREWRVTPEALEAFLQAQRKPKQAQVKTVRPTGPVDLGSWRKVRGKGAA